MKYTLIILFLCSFAISYGASKKVHSADESTVIKETSATNESAPKKNAVYEIADTTVIADLNGDGTDETIKLSLIMKKEGKQEWLDGYQITINDDSKEIKNDIGAEEIKIMIVDIYKKDNQKEIAVVVDIDPDGFYYDIYSYNGSNLIFVAQVDNFFYEDKEPFPGDGRVYANNWMGFWKIYDVYTYNSEKNTFTNDNRSGIYEVIYADGLKPEIKVIKSFKLLKESNATSEVTATLKKGTIVKILKANVSTKCKETGEGDFCHWYYIESKDGNGWVKLSDFMNNVEGIPWAG
jgi:hypothetical protein